MALLAGATSPALAEPQANDPLPRGAGTTEEVQAEEALPSAGLVAIELKQKTVGVIGGGQASLEDGPPECASYTDGPDGSLVCSRYESKKAAKVGSGGRAGIRAAHEITRAQGNVIMKGELSGQATLGSQGGRTTGGVQGRLGGSYGWMTDEGPCLRFTGEANLTASANEKFELTGAGGIVPGLCVMTDNQGILLLGAVGQLRVGEHRDRDGAALQVGGEASYATRDLRLDGRFLWNALGSSGGGSTSLELQGTGRPISDAPNFVAGGLVKVDFLQPGDSPAMTVPQFNVIGAYRFD